MNDADVVVVTGGASGLGRATAEALVVAGMQVAVVDLASSDGETVARDLGAEAHFVAADVTDADAMANAMQMAATLGTVRLAVACAGVHVQRRMLGRGPALSSGMFQSVLAVNLQGGFHLLSAAARTMQSNDLDEGGDRGVVVLVSSAAAFDGQAGHVAYAAAKAGVAGMVLPAARELARERVRVVGVAPGMFATSMVAHLSGEERDLAAAGIPHPKRLGHPHEFAALVAHVAGNRYLNGEVIRLDAGLRLPG